MNNRKGKKAKDERLFRGKLLKTLRKGANMSLAEASRQTYVEVRTLINYENGTHSAPLEVQKRMIEVYGILPENS